MNAAKTLPTLYIPHGGGPCFFMDPPPADPHMWDELAAYLRSIDEGLGVRPKAILVISAHWETPLPTINVAEKPGLLFDYYGFPEHTYHLKYPAAGAPDLAPRVRELLSDAGFDCSTEGRRGLDHGVFVPFLLIYPHADIPIMQMSMHRSLDAGFHLRLGKALQPLRQQGVLIVGSGMSFHNLAATFSGGGGDAAEAFDAWLNDAVQNPATRDAKLVAWRDAPGGRQAHPREEHLIPLMVAAGAAGEDAGVRKFSGDIGGKALSGFQFG